MGARDLLTDLGRADLNVRLIDGKIIVSPKERLTDPLRDAIRAQRAELAALLTPEPATPRPAPTPPSARIYRLTRSQSDAAHAEAWNADTITAFSLRRDALVRRGHCTDDAEDLAERLTLRDHERDDRRMCLECSHLNERGRCLAAAAGRLTGADRRLEPVPTILQRCEAFMPRKGI